MAAKALAVVRVQARAVVAPEERYPLNRFHRPILLYNFGVLFFFAPTMLAYH